MVQLNITAIFRLTQVFMGSKSFFITSSVVCILPSSQPFAIFTLLLDEDFYVLDVTDKWWPFYANPLFDHEGRKTCSTLVH